jgi:hypothetical protein
LLTTSEQRIVHYVRENLGTLATEEDRTAADEWITRNQVPGEPGSNWMVFEYETDGRVRNMSTNRDVEALKLDLITERLLIRVLLQEWDTLPLTIVSTKPELYGEIDRLRSEAEFRFALRGPLTLLGVVLAVRLGAWTSLIPLGIALLVAC